MTNQLKTCLVIPCYNEASRLPITAFQEFMQERPSVGLCFVNDGSSDNTVQVLQELVQNHPQAKVLDLTINGGKAEAVRQGMLSLANEDWDYVGFWDADLATPLSEIENFLPVLAEKSYDSVMGSRIQRLGSQIHRKRFRHILGRVFATIASLTLKLAVYDTQCGSKFYRGNLIGELFAQNFLSHWLFDVELLFRLKNLNQGKPLEETLFELPLSFWKDIHGSRLKITDFLIAPWELWKISRHYGH
jgi:dolichyl-phosphate beta-glucosyltransferase